MTDFSRADQKARSDIAWAQERLTPYREATSNPAALRLLDAFWETVPLGLGAERVVYPYGADKAISFIYDTRGRSRPPHAKMRYYSGKLFHILLGTPDIHFASSSPHINITDRIMSPPDPGGLGDYYELKATDQWKESVAAFHRRLGELGLTADRATTNFIPNQAYEPVFVDTIPCERGLLSGALATQTEALPEPQRERGVHYLTKLLAAQQALKS